MTIYVDADSCPVKAREIIVKAALREGVPACFAANRDIPVPAVKPRTGLRQTAELIRTILVGPEKGATDAFIEENTVTGDLVITRDIPLAARLLDRSITVINDRGVIFDKEFIKERISERDFMYELRISGAVPKSGKVYGPKEIHAFAAALQKSLFSLKSLKNGGIISP